MQLPQIVLASGSPRRKSLLAGLGISFVTRVSDAEELESLPDLGELVEQNALRKARAVGAGPGEVVVGADTLVELDGRPLAKPGGVEEAEAMLAALSGKSHHVLTGLAFLSADRDPLALHVRSRIAFHPLSGETIRKYCRTAEPYDKAGAYGIQGLGALFVREVEGSYTNVVGLPLEDFLKGLERYTGIEYYRWFYRGQ